MKRLEQYQYSVSLVLDNDGRIQIRSSPDMKRYKRVIMEGAVSKFEEILTDYIRPSSSCSSLAVIVPLTDTTFQIFPFDNDPCNTPPCP